MKINIKYISRKYYDKSNIWQWVWTWKRYKYVKGLIIRIFGVYVNIRENNTFEKLIKITQDKRSGYINKI